MNKIFEAMEFLIYVVAASFIVKSMPAIVWKRILYGNPYKERKEDEKEI